MFHPAEDSTQRVARYSMQRGSVHEMGMMLRMEEQQMMMLQMQEMEMMQMQAQGGMPYGDDGTWTGQQPPMMNGGMDMQQPMDGQSPQRQQAYGNYNNNQMMMMNGGEGQMQDVTGFPSAPEQQQQQQRPMMQGEGGQPNAASPGRTKTANGNATHTSPRTSAAAASNRAASLASANGTTPAQTQSHGLTSQPSQVGESSAYGGSSLYNAHPSDNNMAAASTAPAGGGPQAASSIYEGSSMYGNGMTSTYGADTAAAMPSAGPVGYSTYDGATSSSLYGPPPTAAAAAPATSTASPAMQGRRLSPGAMRKPITHSTQVKTAEHTSPSTTATPPGAGVAAPKAASPGTQRRLSGAAGTGSRSPALQRKPSGSNLGEGDNVSLTSHRSREIRQKNSELKRQNSGMTSGSTGSRSPALQRKPSGSNLGEGDNVSLTSHRSREIRQKNSELKRQNSGMTSGRTGSEAVATRPVERKTSSSASGSAKDKKHSSSSSSKNKERGKDSDMEKKHHRSSSSSSKNKDRERRHSSSGSRSERKKKHSS